MICKSMKYLTMTKQWLGLQHAKNIGIVLYAKLVQTIFPTADDKGAIGHR